MTVVPSFCTYTVTYAVTATDVFPITVAPVENVIPGLFQIPIFESNDVITIDVAGTPTYLPERNFVLTFTAVTDSGVSDSGVKPIKVQNACNDQVFTVTSADISDVSYTIGNNA